MIDYHTKSKALIYPYSSQGKGGRQVTLKELERKFLLSSLFFSDSLHIVENNLKLIAN